MEEFENGPLLIWLRTFPDVHDGTTFTDLIVEDCLQKVLQTLESDIFEKQANDNGDNSKSCKEFKFRVRKFENLITSLKYYYEEILGQTVIISLPNTLHICKEPPSKESVVEMERLLLLILGAAVQCSRKEKIVQSLKNLPLSVQEAIVIKIKEVTENPQNIWTPDFSEPTELSENQKNFMYKLLVSHVKNLVKERDDISSKFVDIVATTGKQHIGVCGSDNNAGSGSNFGDGPGSGSTPSDLTQKALEITEYKTKIRKLNQDLIDKIESLSELKTENHNQNQLVQKLKQEKLHLIQESRKAKSQKDQLDIFRERAAKVDKLEADVIVYKEKINELEYFKSRIDEYREDNKILTEAKEMLMGQLKQSRKRSENIFQLETEIVKYKSMVMDLNTQKEHDQHKIDELIQENLNLSLNTKSSIMESKNLLVEIESLKNQDKDNNVMSEQLGQEMPKIHRLEMENVLLKSQLESIKRDEFHAHSDKILELEKENKVYSLKIKQLEERINKETAEISDLEMKLFTVDDKNKSNLQVIAALQEAEEEARMEKEGLQKQVESLRERAERGQNEQLNLLADENKKLIKEATLAERQIRSLNSERTQIAHDSNEEIKSQKEKINSLTSELEALKENQLEMKLSLENKEASTQRSLRRKEQKLEEANLEIIQLKENIDRLKKKSVRLSVIEKEKNQLNETVEKLKSEIENIKKNLDEITVQEKKAVSDVRIQKKQMDTLHKKIKELQVTNAAVDEENKKLQRHNDTLKDIDKKVESLETSNLTLESEHHLSMNKSLFLEKEIERYRSYQIKQEAEIDDLNSKISTIENENKKLATRLKSNEEEQFKIEKLDSENRKLNQQATMAFKDSTILREQLVAEKVMSESLNVEIETIKDHLNKKLGLNIDTLKSTDQKDLCLPSLQYPEDKREINNQESLNSELNSTSVKIRNEKDYSLEKTELKQVIKLKEEADDEISKLNSIILELENKNALLKTEVARVEHQLVNLTKDRAALQVENTTLSSQSSMLLIQINNLHSVNMSLGTDQAELEKKVSDLVKEKKQLTSDQKKLYGLYDSLQGDYDTLLKEKEIQKEEEKRLRKELTKLQLLSKSLTEDQDEIIRAKEAVDEERESLLSDFKTLSNLRSEHARLKDDFRLLFTSNEKVKTEFCNLQTDYRSLKTIHNNLMLKHTEIQGEMAEIKHQNISLGVDNTKLSSKLEILDKMNDSLKEDRQAYVSQVRLLLTQYHELLTQTLYDKDHFHEEAKEYAEKMSNLARQKEKLEEKIFEQYKKMERSTSKKTGGLKSQIVQKVKKASSHLISGNKSRSNGALNLSSTVGAGPPPGVQLRNRTRVPRPVPIIEDGLDSSSLGSGGNDSLDSGAHSPNTTASETNQGKFSDHNNGVSSSSSSNSIISASTIGGESNGYLEDHVTSKEGTHERITSNHGELGLPNGDNRLSRNGHKYYDNDHNSSSSDRSVTPRLSSAIKSDNSFQNMSNVNHQNNGAPPIKPRIFNSIPPKRPPKPTERKQDIPNAINDFSDEASNANNSIFPRKTEEWYEYGCV